MSTTLAYLPSPTVNQFSIFGLTIRAYALCILAGIVVAIWLSTKRWVARGGKSEEIMDLAVWAVPFGIIGGRIYHVISSPAAYFGENGDPIRALYIWEGGLGIWGAIAFGAVGAWIGARRMGLRMSSIADALAPGLIFAQAIGRLGNWFNNELYGGPDNSFLGLKIYEMGADGRAVTGADGQPVLVGTFQPTFLYELVWNVLVGLTLLWLDRKYRMGRGRLFAAYVALYCLGRFFIEQMRSDEAELILGQRVNVWTSLLVGLAAVAYLIVVKGGREASPYTDERLARDAATTPADPSVNSADPSDNPADPSDKSRDPRDKSRDPRETDNDTTRTTDKAGD
ncbi:prolipoprotein diacylglyceryl transferase [Epidermidibacterium keratini]|uniref:Phosphatidylglycerol--prolipoprotein diacylglyceryl transferase n=2 Tax=Epidermidibacterium keratini TaxID=1891644 RepID=A0A7L4YSJ0_9ACTN|nr:prolipoprotein diacylglyceryl transferase [Epidermidibacterium keratini]